MVDTHSARTGTKRLQTILAKPWLYERSGRIYLRLRPRKATTNHFTLSLRTTDRNTAMLITRDILRALKAFHLDNPALTWPEIKERLHVVAEECLTMAHGDDSLMAYAMIYGDHSQSLIKASAQMPLTVAQQRGVREAQDIMDAAQERLQGNAQRLVGIVEKLGEPDPKPASLSLSVRGPAESPKEPVTWESLTTSYLEEHGTNVKASTLSSLQANYRTLGAAFQAIGVTDLYTHTRTDMVALRAELLSSRKPSTVNNLITQMSTALDWAVRNDLIPKAYTTKLKLTKGAESEREAFTRAQVMTLMAKANSMPIDSWERWGLSVLAITGARVGEVAQLGPQDIFEVDGHLCISINEDTPDKSIKNKFSNRIVPLVDGALGFKLSEFRQAVAMGSLASTQVVISVQVRKRLGKLMRDTLGDDRAETQTLHSLRHHLASSLKSAGVPVAYAQAILGHSTGTITYDDYGSDVPVSVLAKTLAAVFKIS